MSRFGFYTPSYMRADTTTTFQLFPFTTYVVRRSEEEAYKKNGIRNIIAVEDDLIDSFQKVHTWMFETDRIPENIICILDDDIKKFRYRIGYQAAVITDADIVRCEFERIMQIMEDLEIGYGGLSQTSSPYNYNSEISFNSITGSVRFVNRKKLKARFEEMEYFADIDFVLQELLENRIIFRPNYICSQQGLETNAGGSNEDRATRERRKEYKEIIKPKWGKYFEYNAKKNTPKILVPR